MHENRKDLFLQMKSVFSIIRQKQHHLSKKKECQKNAADYNSGKLN